MKIVILGGDDVIAARLADMLLSLGHCTQNVAELNCQQVETALASASAVVDLTQSLSHRGRSASACARSRGFNIASAARLAGIAHYVTLSDIGADHLASTYFQAQRAHEHLIVSCPLAHTFVRMAPSFEGVECFVRHASFGGVARLPAALMQPISADDAACVLARIVLGRPQYGVLELAGPEVIELEELARELASAREIPLRILVDPETLYFDASVDRRSLLPGAGALLGADTFSEWLRRSIPPG